MAGFTETGMVCAEGRPPSRLVLGIESSCDDTGAAVVSSTGEILGEALATQAEIHAPWGGVVPKLAQEAHERAIDGAPICSCPFPTSGLGTALFSAVDTASKATVRGMAFDCEDGPFADVVEKALERAGVSGSDIEAVAVTIGPGLSLCLRASAPHPPLPFLAPPLQT